jgi:outer membrane protein insertion porin family
VFTQIRKTIAFLILLSTRFLNLSPAGVPFYEQIKSLEKPEEVSFFLDKITFESDVHFSKKEFFYLTNLKAKKTFTKKDVDLAYKSLMQKKQFSKVEIEMEDTPNGKHLHFKLTANWIFKKLKLKGIWFGKYNYENQYLMQPGDIFDIKLHQESIQNIKNHLKNKGYLECKVVDEISYNKKEKSITTYIYIKKRETYVIKSISFEITKNEPKSDQKWEKEKLKFKNRLRKKIGLPILDTNYSKAFVKKGVEKIRSFFNKRGFVGCQISVKRLINKNKKLVHLVFNIKLGKKRFLSFKGNTIFTKKQITQDILGLDYPDWLFSPEIIAGQVLHEYQNKGYWKAKIRYKKLDSESFDFTITEGNPILIESIEIQEQNKNILSEHATLFAELIKKKIFDEQLLNKGIENLKNFYISNGFWDFEITNKKFIKNKNNEQYKIILYINKGKQRFWNGLKISNFENLEKEIFFIKYIYDKNATPTPFNFYWLQEQRAFLLANFQNQGFWYAEIQPDLTTYATEKNNNQVFVLVDWKIKTGPQIKFGKVLVTGNTRLPFDRILKEVQFKQGDVWNKQKIDQTRKRLKKLDIFKHIQIQPYKITKDKNEAREPILLNLVDDDPLQASLRLGYFWTSKNFWFRPESTYRAGASLLVKNPTNHADKVAFNADVTKFERKLNLDYQVPSPFGLSLADSSLIGKCKIYSNKYVHPVQIRKSGSAFEAYQNGFSFGLNNEYKQDYFFGLNLGNEWVKTSRVRGDLNFSKSLENKILPFFFLEPSVIIDKLDDKLDVKKGSLTFFSLKFMLPEYKGITTGKIMFEQSLFNPIYKDIIFGARLRFGHIFRRDFQDVQPIERFFLGGPYTVRGYEKDALPPLGVSGKTDKKYTIQGGSSMLNGNAEIRFPIYKAIRGVVFQDVGVLSQKGVSGFYGKWYPSTGVGLRYKTPIGAIRFDIGWKWKKILPGDTSYAWYLTLGEAF